MESISATNAKKIGQLMDRVVQSGEPIAIKRSGRPQVVVVPWRKWNKQCYLTKADLGQPREETREELMLSGAERAKKTAASG